VDGWRAFLGRYGISGKLQTTKISHLSEGQKSRIVFGILCMKNHNLLLLVRWGAGGGAAGGWLGGCELLSSIESFTAYEKG